MLETIAAVNQAVNNFVWGVPAMVCIIGVGLLLSVRTGFLQIRKFPYAIKTTIGRMFRKKDASDGAMTPFQAVCTALAGTVGTGNIAGVAGAIAIGGPGAVFWMWCSALLGMCTKFAEVTLAVHYRERNAAGEWVGGPMYYIKNGLGRRWKWLAALFCIFAALAALGTGNAIQAGNIVGAINTLVLTIDPAFTGTETLNLVVGIVLAVLAAIVLFGGVKRLGAVTEKLVPGMAVIYVVTCLSVVLFNADRLPSVFHDIFTGAFSPGGVTGGAVGSMFVALSWGVKRGIFSNEAGLGTAPMAHATTSEKEPVKQAVYGIFEVFNTIIICTLTGLTMLCSGIDLHFGTTGETALVSSALGTLFTPQGGALIIAVCLVLFAFSTILGWALYGSRCCEFLLGPKAIKPYRVVYVLITVVGATTNLELVWSIADTLNGLMALPNLVALAALSGVVVKTTREHFAKERDEKESAGN